MLRIDKMFRNIIFTPSYRAAHEAGHAISTYFIILREVKYASIRRTDAQGRRVSPCVRFITPNQYYEERFFAAGIAGVAFGRSKYFSRAVFPIDAMWFILSAFGSSDDIFKYHTSSKTNPSLRSLSSFYRAIKDTIDELAKREDVYDRIRLSLLQHSFLSKKNIQLVIDGEMNIDIVENNNFFAQIDFFAD